MHLFDLEGDIFKVATINYLSQESSNETNHYPPPTWSLDGGLAGQLNGSSPQSTANSIVKCTNNSKAYMAIVITVVPLWVILTALIVLVLFCFHQSFRATKIYDDCTKLNALFSYHIELRTGDTSVTYNRRRTTMTIDMFDENQQSLARIALPAHVVFGRKNSLIGPVEDEKYAELRVTRFWLFRAVKLKRISTIRITHSCFEPEAKIMIYGLAIRSNEPDQHKQFFPIMSYISAFGSSVRQNACFDSEPNGSISDMGGPHDYYGFVSGHLSRIDYTVLVYLLSAVVWYLASQRELFLTGQAESSSLFCVYNGAIIGIVSYGLILVLAWLHKNVIKYYYSLNIGLGFFGVLYPCTLALVIVAGSGVWILTTVYAYRSLCPSLYSEWLLTIGVAMLEVSALAVLTLLIYFSLHQLLIVKSADQYTFPDDYSLAGTHAVESSISRKGSPHYSNSGAGGSRGAPPVNMSPNQWAAAGGGQYYGPPGAHSPPAPAAPHPQTAFVQPTAAGQQQHFRQLEPPGAANLPLGNLQQVPIVLHQPRNPSPEQSYHNQMSGSHKPKRSGSNESTGSSYYHQLMRQKGGVKSISQYGELMKQRKGHDATPPPGKAKHQK